MSQESFVSRAKAPPVKGSEKGHGDENGVLIILMSDKNYEVTKGKSPKNGTLLNTFLKRMLTFQEKYILFRFTAKKKKKKKKKKQD